MEALDSGNSMQETAAPNSTTQEEACYRDLQEQGSLSSSSGLEKRPSKKEAEDKQLDHERQEEQTFLVNLYKFMKEQNTPIERIPHLGFKQINLWRIHQAVENLGGYELVTGRRLWKNVYDKLGGSPGSTSAATCTRRHYERLVLPYVWDMKGENGKPLPPTKPRKQYRLCKEKGEDAREKNKKMRKEKNYEQIPLEKEKHESNLVAKEENQESNQQPNIKDRSRPLSQSNSQEPSKAFCIASPQQLVSSLYAHGIMSPLAKKKLLAQASKDGNCGKHGSAGLGDQSTQGKEELLDSGSPSTILQAKSPSAEECLRNIPPSLPSNVGLGVYSGKDPQNGTDQPSGNHSPSSPVFTGSFHVYRNDFYKPFNCSPLRDPEGYAPAFKTCTDLSVYRAPSKDMKYNSLMSQPKETDSQKQTTEGHSQGSRPMGSWSLDGSLPPACSSRSRESSPFLTVKRCWVPPITHLTRVLPKPSPQSLSPSTRKTSVVQPIFHKPACSPASLQKRCMGEMETACRKKMRTASTFPNEMELKDKSDSGLSKPTQLLVNRPKPLLPGSALPLVLTPSVLSQDMYKERMMLSYPTYLSHTTSTLKNPSPELPSQPFRPFVLPPFSGNLLPTAVQPLATSLVPNPMACDSSLRHRLYPMSAWQLQPACIPLHRPIPQLNTRL
nr:AT-rich interactive domain-containing protein 5A isoform X2 [Geotrypetes seraphini]